MKILIIGATGSLGQKVRKTILEQTDWQLTLFSRSANRLKDIHSRETVINGDVLNKEGLKKAISGQDAVFVALSGQLERMAQTIVEVMNASNVNRIIFITSMGIYNEIPDHLGSSGNLQTNPYLQSYRQAADVIEASNLAYTIIRPGWFDNGSNQYTISRKGQLFEGHDVSRQAIANFVLELLEQPDLYVKESVGIHRPE
ncbi:NAD(P)H-binding protein [Staphylococcus americanisciuri]|uniref:NAD(P)H-binding protein n=1 Tax=Staphylococcus americanisciuri TaxID=2973940 RepID=A0ABT2F1D9_9STAP|nr:NAD(P)H-binding protein [Staphylococcus americanisciuri]MCS4486258.1 NAD(P)H-binding protein [Staphylococcus americanisciuri]